MSSGFDCTVCHKLVQDLVEEDDHLSTLNYRLRKRAEREGWCECPGPEVPLVAMAVVGITNETAHFQPIDAAAPLEQTFVMWSGAVLPHLGRPLEVGDRWDVPLHWFEKLHNWTAAGYVLSRGGPIAPQPPPPEVP